MLQRDNLWPWLSARANVIISLRLAGHRDTAAAASEALAAFGLGARATLAPARCPAASSSASRSPRRRRAGAPLVLADEPTGELDAANERLVLDALRELRDAFGSTVVVVTHSARVSGAADRVVEMRDGRVET